MISLKNRSRSEASEGVISRNLGLILIVLAAVPVGLAVHTAEDRQLSGLETVLFAVLVMILSLIGSAFVTAHFARSQARDTYIQLARPAWRRVVELNNSAGLIGDAVHAKSMLLAGKDVISAEVAVEWLDSIDRLIEQHAGQLQAAISDWQELLPEEYEELASVQALRGELDAKIEEIRVLQKEQNTDAQRQVGELSAEVNHLRDELVERQAALPPSTRTAAARPSPAAARFAERRRAARDRARALGVTEPALRRIEAAYGPGSISKMWSEADGDPETYKNALRRADVQLRRAAVAEESGTTEKGS